MPSLSLSLPPSLPFPPSLDLRLCPPASVLLWYPHGLSSVAAYRTASSSIPYVQKHYSVSSGAA
eukprot:444705-Rhodomonas_salina.2